ncbi:unnamed protein product [Cercospora beticola]|nr:unnamed protein product [Cercospora beticola]
MPTRIFKNWVAVSENDSNPAESNPPQLRLPNAPAFGKSVATQVNPRFELLLPGEPIAIDIEFQDFKNKDTGFRWRHRLAWFAALNTRGETVLDVFVQYPPDEDTEFQLPRAKGKTFGVTRQLLTLKNGAVKAAVVEPMCEALFRGRPVVLHGGQHDLTAFQYCNPYQGATAVFDTQRRWAGDSQIPEESRAKPGLAILAQSVLGRVVQANGAHSPVEDAHATMVLHLMKGPYDREAEAKKWKGVWETQQTQQVPYPLPTINQNFNQHSTRGNHTVSGSRGGHQVINTSSGQNGQIVSFNGNITHNHVEVKNFYSTVAARGHQAATRARAGRGASRGVSQGRGAFQGAVRGGGLQGGASDKLNQW